MNRLIGLIGWLLFSLLGASAFAVIALNRGESISAIWIVIAAVCVYLIAFRFYSLFIANRVLKLDETRMT
ncbi:carbon starvation protein A, partial [candidate division WWE3 bacterium]|nr:carbon starvation protein A [candidate division WWE3 bacterium]